MAIKWNSSILFPTDSNFVNRITELNFGPSNSSGNPMVTMTTEVVEPQSVEVAGQVVTISGIQCKNYYVTESRDEKTGDIDEEKTAHNRKRLVALLSNLGVDSGCGLNLDMQDVDGIDLKQCKLNWDNLGPQLQPLKGRLILTMMSPDEEEKTKTPTKSQIDAGKAKGLKLKDIKGDVMKNPITGKALINYWPKVREIFGSAPNQDDVQIPF